MSENITGTDRNNDTSTSMGTTVSVSLTTTLADASSTEDPVQDGHGNMYELVIFGLLATVIPVHSDVSYHFFVKNNNNDIITCNWKVEIFCGNSSVIDIYNVTILITSCGGICTPCDGSGRSVYSTGVNTTAIQSYIISKCNNSISCNDSLPVAEVTNHQEMTVTVYYNCTNTSTTKKDSGTTVSVFSSPTTYAAGISENITGTHTNTDTSPSKTNETTVGVSSSPATQADVTSSEDLDTAIQPSSLNVVSAVVPTVLVLVAITLVSLVIIARRMRRRTGDKTAIRSDFDKGVSRDGASAEANRSVNGVQLSTIADDNGEYNTINLITLPVTDGLTYNHVNSPIGNVKWDKTNVSPLIDSDYASCADIDESVIVDDTYSHTTNELHTINEMKSNQGLPAKESRSDYDHIELAKFNDNNADELATGDYTYSHIGTELVNGMSMVDVEHFGDDYSHIGHVVHDTDAENSTNLKRRVAEARSSKSNIVNTCENRTGRNKNIENNEYRDIHDSQEDTCGNGNVNELNGVEIHPLYQLQECDDSIASNHSYFTLEKM